MVTRGLSTGHSSVQLIWAKWQFVVRTEELKYLSMFIAQIHIVVCTRPSHHCGRITRDAVVYLKFQLPTYVNIEANNFSIEAVLKWIKCKQLDKAVSGCIFPYLCGGGIYLAAIVGSWFCVTEGSDCVVSVRGICSLMLNLFTRRVDCCHCYDYTKSCHMSALVLLLFSEHTLVPCAIHSYGKQCAAAKIALSK